MKVENRISGEGVWRLRCQLIGSPLSRAARVMIAVLTALWMLVAPVSAYAFQGLGRMATPEEVRAWDIDVRPDLKGLPKGRGSVSQGMEVWESKCASCHGVFGESNEVFTPVVGGTDADDIKTGRVKSLHLGSVPQRTTLMKVPTLSTLWDYINRAMPWNAPKTLKTGEVYAVTAYILNLGGIVGEDFELSNENFAQVQQRMPNRNGMQQNHGMWLVSGKPDVHEKRCMSNCSRGLSVTSQLPEYARDAHGNLADQNRTVGPVRGQVTSKSIQVAQVGSSGASAKLEQFGCMACHAAQSKLVGPSWKDVAQKYPNAGQSLPTLIKKVRTGGSGVWGNIPMPPHQDISEHDLDEMVNWILKQQ